MPPKGGRTGPPEEAYRPAAGAAPRQGDSPPDPRGCAPTAAFAAGVPLWAVHTERSDCGQCSQRCPGPAIPLFGSHEIKKNGGATGVCAARRAVAHRERQGCFAAEAVGSRGTAVRRLSTPLWGGQLGYPQPERAMGSCACGTH